jgi:hypothetical protein
MRDGVTQGIGLLFETSVIGGYFLAAYLFNAWLLVLAPFILAAVAIVWAVVRAHFDHD